MTILKYTCGSRPSRCASTETSHAVAIPTAIIDLHRLAVAAGPDLHDVGADRLEQRLCGRDVVDVAAEHQGEAPVLGTLHTAGDRGIDEPNARTSSTDDGAPYCSRYSVVA